MRLWYLLMRFNGNGVSGMISVAENPEQARKNCLSVLNAEIKRLRSYSDSYFSETSVLRPISFRRTLNNPHRKTSKGEPVLKIMEINGSFHTGYWMSNESDSSSQYLCNLPIKWEQDPVKGFSYSELKK